MWEVLVTNLKKEKEALKAEADNLKKDRNELTEQIEKLNEGDSEKQNFYRKLEEENALLKDLAYVDDKTGVWNLNAFNKDFPTMEDDKDSTILAMVSITGTKMINITYGKKRGDKVIKIVAEELSKIYSKDHIYRILGDQFEVIITGENYEDVESKLKTLKESLAKQQINVSYGIAIGANCTTLQQMVKVSEDNAIQMKSGAESGHILADNTPAEKTEEKAPQEKKPEKPKPVTPDDPEEVDVDDMLMQYMNEE